MPEHAMTYICVNWHHSHPDEPIVCYSEIDEERWERRKVEVFREGPPGYASGTESTRSTMLGLEAVPPIDKIAAIPEFEPREILKEEFEQVWAEAIRQSPHLDVDDFTIPHLVNEFLKQDCDAPVRDILLAEINKHGAAKADIFRHFTFNRFNVRLDFRNREATVEDVLGCERTWFVHNLTCGLYCRAQQARRLSARADCSDIRTEMPGSPRLSDRPDRLSPQRRAHPGPQANCGDHKCSPTPSMR